MAGCAAVKLFEAFQQLNSCFGKTAGTIQAGGCFKFFAHAHGRERLICVINHIRAIQLRGTSSKGTAMGKRHSLKFNALGIISLGAIALSTPAAAGQCGYIYPVDAPTTLSKVARACGVTVSALREANPGVDPGYVRPGQHVSVPPKRPDGAAAPVEDGPAPVVTANNSDSVSGSTHPYIVDPDYASASYEDANEDKLLSPLGNDGRNNDARIRVRDTRVADTAPVWLQDEATQGGHYGETSRLSFQKQSAMRIRNAGYKRTSLSIPSPDGVPAARFTENSAIVLVPDHTGYKLPDYSTIGKLSDHTKTEQISFALNGHVKAVEGGCLVLQSADNVTWRLAMPSPANQLVGKTVTAWGVKGAGASCGDGLSMLVSHAIYAEPWQSQRETGGINP